MRSERNSAELVGGESLLNFGLLACLAPMLGVEDAARGPLRQQTEEVAQVSPWLELVLLAAGNQRDERGVPLGAVVTADEEPVLPPDKVLSYATFVQADKVAGARGLVWLGEAFRVLGSTPAGLMTGTLDVLFNRFGLGTLVPAAVSRVAALGALWPVGVFFQLEYLRPTLLFEVLHALCARDSGPFVAPDGGTDETYFTPLEGVEVKYGASKGKRVTLAASDNDGIVNTLSMFWPRPAAGRSHEVFLVEADHADIIGHHSLRPKRAKEVGNRKFDAYDLFQSKSGFSSKHFEALWGDIFAFSA